MADQIPLLEKALAAAPDNWPVRRYLIEYYAADDQLDRAADLVKGAHELPEEERDQLFAAEVLAKADPRAADRLLDDILRSNAACARAHVIKAAMQRLAGDEKKAASHAKVAQVLDPDLDIEAAIAGAVAIPEAPAEELPLEVSRAVQLYTAAVAMRADPEDGEQAEIEVVAAPEMVVEPEPEPAPTQQSGVPSQNAPLPLSNPRMTAVPLPEAPTRPQATASVAIPLTPRHSSYAGTTILPPAPVEEAHDADADADAGMEGGYEGGQAEAERSFIVGDGGMVKAHSRDPDTKEKLSAITTAILVHIGLIAILTAYVIAVPRVKPPSIIVSSSPLVEKPELPKPTLVKEQETMASTVQQAAPVVTVESFSAFAVPEVVTDMNDLSLITFGNDAGTLGMSMTGMGDVSNMGSIPAAMRSRCSMSQRMKRLRESGGEERAERAVRDALEFLATQQNKENGAFGKEFPAAMTGLSLLAFLGHCETPESKVFGDAVISAAQYLMRRGRAHDKGMIYNGKPGNHSAYEHAIATYALAELFTMTKESGREIPQLDSVLRRAVKVIVDGQTRVGGWLYNYSGAKDGDFSVAGWQIQALKAAYNTGKKYAGVELALDRAMEYTKGSQDEAGAIRYRFSDTVKPGHATLAGAGVLAMQMWGLAGTPEATRGLDFIEKNFMSPVTQTYGAYYNTQALFLAGGKRWDDYNAKFQKQVLDLQKENGSWELKIKHGPKGEESVIYGTALTTLMLEVYYRYLPTTDKLDGLKVE